MLLKGYESGISYDSDASSGLIMTTTLSTNGNLTYVTIDACSSKWIYRMEHTHAIITSYDGFYIQSPNCPGNNKDKASLSNFIFSPLEMDQVS